MTPTTTIASPRKHQQPSSRWLTRALLSVAVLATSAHAVCIPLTSSKTCPSYAAFQVDTGIITNMASYGIIMPAFTTVEEFDRAVNNATGFETSTDCTTYNSSVRIPYQNTVLCSIAVQEDLSSKCKNQATTNSNMCDSSCTLYQQGLTAMVNTRCPKASLAISQLADLAVICARKTPNDWSGLHDNTTSCINSLQNEVLTCGLTTLADKCTFCKTNTTASCCSDAVATCNYTSTATALPTRTSSTAPTSTSSTDGAADPTSSSSGISKSTLGGIVGGSIGGVIVLALVLFLCIRRTNKSTAAKGSGLARQASNVSDRYKISNPKLVDDGFVAATTIPMTTLPPISNDSSFGLAGAATGGAVAAAGAEALAGREATGKQSYCQALYPYQASMADELDLLPGDIVNVQRVFDDGWAVGVNMNTSNEGAFPVVCVMFVDESALDDDFEDVNMHSMQPMTLREEDHEGRRSPSGRNSPRSSLPSRSSSPVNLPRRNSSIRDSTVVIPGLSGSNTMTSSPLASSNSAGGQGRGTAPVIRDTMMSDASSINRWWEGERKM